MLKSSMESTIRKACSTITDLIFGARYHKTEAGYVTLTKQQFTQLAELREYLFKTIQVIDKSKKPCRH